MLLHFIISVTFALLFPLIAAGFYPSNTLCLQQNEIYITQLVSLKLALELEMARTIFTVCI